MEKILKNQVVKIEINDTTQDTNYKYLEASKGFLGFSKREAGIYLEDWDRTLLPLIKIPTHLNKNNNKIFIKPNVVLHLTNGKEKVYYFNEMKDAHAFVNLNFAEREFVQETGEVIK